MENMKLRSVQVIPEHFKKYEVRALCQMCDHIMVRHYEYLEPTLDLGCLNCGNTQVVDSASRQMIANEGIELEQLLQDSFNNDNHAVVHSIEYNDQTKEFTVSTYQAIFNMELIKWIELEYGYKLVSFNMQSSALRFKKEPKK